MSEFLEQPNMERETLQELDKLLERIGRMSNITALKIERSWDTTTGMPPFDEDHHDRKIKRAVRRKNNYEKRRLQEAA
jgi:hypothetical protein